MRQFRILSLSVLILSMVAFNTRADDPAPPTNDRANLALGKTVTFSPPPDYALTAEGGADATDLTDGKITARPDERLWYESSSVGWSYSGRVSLEVDLGADCDIDEIAIRLQNGSAGAGVHFPGWVEAFVSADGERFAKVGEFSRWNEGDFQKFGIGRERGRSYVDALRFQGLKARGRFVGLRLYVNDMMVSDELQVFGKPAEPGASVTPESPPSGFVVSHPQIYFHKPYLELATNLALPVPVGLATRADAADDVKVSFYVDLPPGLELLGETTATTEKADETGWTRRRFAARDAGPGKNSGDGKVLERLYLRATGWSDGQQGELRYGFESGGWTSGPLRVPVKAVAVPEAPRLKKIMATLGWWDATSMGWPDELKAFKTLGINTFNVFSTWMPKDRNHPRWAMIEEARRDGFLISNIDSPIHKMLSAHKDDGEIFDQFEDGSTNNQLCLSYRGQFYRDEIARYADEMAAVRPDFASVDIELWGWAGPPDAKKCVRCRADFAKSGLKSWEDWQKAKGSEIIGDLMNSAREAVRRAGGKPFRVGGYDFRPGTTYQAVFDFDALYPELLQHGEVSTYSSLQPADIAFIGDEARKDRARLPRGDLTPWNTPGDAGVFPGEAFQWSLLENFCNGARGVWFWSSRMWDSESLIAYNKVVRALAPVEDVIVDGNLIGDAVAVVGPGRISGVKLDGRMVLLAADYLRETNGSIKLRPNLTGEFTLIDLFTGKPLDPQPAAGEQTMTIPLEGGRARLLEARPK